MNQTICYRNQIICGKQKKKAGGCWCKLLKKFSELKKDNKKQQTLTFQHFFSKDEDNSSAEKQNVIAITTQVRNTALKYITGHQHELSKLNDIQETKSFSILVTQLASQNEGLVSVKIRCEPCGNPIALHQQRKSNSMEAHLIKNWKTHIRM